MSFISWSELIWKNHSMGEWAYNITQELICWSVYRLLTIQVDLYVHSRDLPHELASIYCINMDKRVVVFRCSFASLYYVLPLPHHCSPRKKAGIILATTCRDLQRWRD